MAFCGQVAHAPAPANAHVPHRDAERKKETQRETQRERETQSETQREAEREEEAIQARGIDAFTTTLVANALPSGAVAPSGGCCGTCTNYHMVPFSELVQKWYYAFPVNP
eukprot:COSAG03_NODE_6805_length_1003_cov_1.313053_1_plen_110_part_00